MFSEDFSPVIGLEVHVELKTTSKMFCGCTTDYFGHEPNTHSCPVCLGLPGALPVPNKKAIEWCVLIGLAINCQIPKISKFDRKNYFYPDLPKGYQISQYDMPLCVNGKLVIARSFATKQSEKIATPRTIRYGVRNDDKTIRIRRVHMEEDTGKLIHTREETLIDFNRSGVPLIEIVTEPDIHTAQEAKIFLQKLQQIIRYLGVSDCDMEKGTMRLEPNISLQKVGERGLPSYKVEIKNINSFKFVEKAIDYEIKRQTELLNHGEKIKQETRGFDPQKGVTLPQRGKEEAQDYRYFPEPDIPPMILRDKDIKILRAKIPELPDTKLARFMKEYGLSEYDANILTTSLPTANYFEEAISDSGKWKVENGKPLEPKIIANWIINKKVDINKTLPAQFIQMILQKTQIITISDEELRKTIQKVLLDNPKAVSDYKSGKTQALMFLVGQVMKETKGQAEAGKIRERLIREI